MKLTYSLCTLFLLLSGICSAQTFYPRTDTFVFDNTRAITSWNGSDPANPPYPGDMGYVNLNTPGIYVPFQLGYLNDGQLTPCNSMAWGPKVWTVGDGTHDGDTYSEAGLTTCPDFTGEYGTSGNSWNILDGFSVVTDYKRHIYFTCKYGTCTKHINDTLQGGTGTAQQTEINPGA